MQLAVSNSEFEPNTVRKGFRSQARERALLVIYEAQAKDIAISELLKEFPLEVNDFVAELLAGVEQHKDELNKLIAANSIDWSLDRMPWIDLIVLQLAAFELKYHLEVPIPTIISEAVELVKSYSTEDSRRFVNGVLASIANEVRN